MKKERTILTPEALALRKVARKETLRLGFRQGIIPLLLEFAFCAVCVLFFVFVIANDALPKLANVPVVLNGDEYSDPSLFRLIYMILCFPAIVVLLIWAGKIKQSRFAFWPAFIAGIMLWQAIGECSWHFGLWVGPLGEAVFVSFPRIEAVQGLFILILVLPLFILCLKKKCLSFVLRIFILTFISNWIGHYLTMGLSPMWSWSFYPTPARWPKFAGFVLGLHGGLMLLYRLLFKAKTEEERLTLSILLYGFIGLFLSGGLGIY